MSDEPTCESCGAPAFVRLVDDSYWCLQCESAAERLGYNHDEDGNPIPDQRIAEVLGVPESVDIFSAPASPPRRGGQEGGEGG